MRTSQPAARRPPDRLDILFKHQAAAWFQCEYVAALGREFVVRNLDQLDIPRMEDFHEFDCKKGQVDDSEIAIEQADEREEVEAFVGPCQWGNRP